MAALVQLAPHECRRWLALRSCAASFRLCSLGVWLERRVLGGEHVLGGCLQQQHPIRAIVDVCLHLCGDHGPACVAPRYIINALCVVLHLQALQHIAYA